MEAPRRRRDRDRERSFLEGAGCERFALPARARLEEGARCYADAWASRGLPALVAELAEEAADIGAWGALADQALELEDLEPSAREAMGGRLRAAVEHGAHARRALIEAGLLARRERVAPCR